LPIKRKEKGEKEKGERRKGEIYSRKKISTLPWINQKSIPKNHFIPHTSYLIPFSPFSFSPFSFLPSIFSHKKVKQKQNPGVK